MNDLSVSVIIPTTGRESLFAAIESVRSQTLPPAEVIVCFDGSPERAQFVARRVPVEVRVLNTGKKSNANVARNLGVHAAQAPLVAFLDDDDTWCAGKLASQLRALPEGQRWLSATAILATNLKGTSVRPARPPRANETVVEYLFGKHLWSSPQAILQTSTWLMPRNLAMSLPFREDLSIHQDIDWLVRAEARGVRLRFVQEPLTRYRVAGADSTTAASRTLASLAWSSDPSLPITPRDRGTLILGLTLHVSLRAFETSEVLRVWARAFSLGRPPWMAVFVAAVKTAVTYAGLWRRPRPVSCSASTMPRAGSSDT